ncbi:MAG: multiheme c-type cytochrome [Candidatus Zixiibacteriota bacterium]
MKHQIIITILLWLAISLSSMAQVPPQSSYNPELYGISRYRYTSAQSCKKCHTHIYRIWSQSMHAKGLEDPVFKADYLLAIMEEGEKIKSYCLSCHVPTVDKTNDYNINREISKEGVTCDFCHSVSAVDLSKSPDPFEMDIGESKYGPYRNTSSPAHAAVYSKIHTESEFCGACHELENKNGVLIMGTYSEWKESPYPAKGIHCQNCHMPKIFGLPVVDPKIKKTDHMLTAHEFLGGHSQINLAHAAQVRTEVKMEKDKAIITTYITNAESGHKLPTGTPSRKVILETRILDESDNILAETKKVYRKVLMDENGVILEKNYEMILKSKSIFSDNRIAPKETRKEEFVFDIPKGVDSFRVESVLKYEFLTPVVATKLMEVEMAKDSKSVSVK